MTAQKGNFVKAGTPTHGRIADCRGALLTSTLLLGAADNRSSWMVPAWSQLALPRSVLRMSYGQGQPSRRPQVFRAGCACWLGFIMRGAVRPNWARSSTPKNCESAGPSR